jgi:hypothetical protein
MQHVVFVEISFTGRTVFIVVRCSVITSDLLSKNRFRLQGKVVEVSRI